MFKIILIMGGFFFIYWGALAFKRGNDIFGTTFTVFGFLTVFSVTAKICVDIFQ